MSIIVIGISGPKGSGKSEVAKYLVSECGFERTAFADPIKQMLMTGFGLTREQLYGSEKEIPTDKLCGRTPRHAMNTMGTEWGREMIHKDLWLNRWAEGLRDRGEGRFVIEDVRFPNEMDAVKRFELGAIVRIARPDHLSDSSHESEAHKLPFDYLIENDRDLETLHERLRGFANLIGVSRTSSTSEKKKLGYWDLEFPDIAAPGWWLLEGYACGPSAERAAGDNWITAATYEDVVWRTWCDFFGLCHRHDEDTTYPTKPSDWLERVKMAKAHFDRSRISGCRILTEDR